MQRLKMSSTMITDAHFQQVILEVKNLERLNVSNCSSLDQSCIFLVKQELKHVDIIILTVACLCSCRENLEILVVHGHEFSAEELPFPLKTLNQFPAELWNWEPTMGRGWYVMITFAEELFGDNLLFRVLLFVFVYPVEELTLYVSYTRVFS